MKNNLQEQKFSQVQKIKDLDNLLNLNDEDKNEKNKINEIEIINPINRNDEKEEIKKYKRKSKQKDNRFYKIAINETGVSFQSNYLMNQGYANKTILNNSINKNNND